MFEREADKDGKRDRHQQGGRQRHPRDKPGLLQELPPLERPAEQNLTASADMANKAPTACMGPERSHFSLSRGNPVDQCSALSRHRRQPPPTLTRPTVLLCPDSVNWAHRRSRVHAADDGMPSGRPEFDVHRGSGSASHPHAGPPITSRELTPQNEKAPRLEASGDYDSCRVQVEQKTQNRYRTSGAKGQLAAFGCSGSQVTAPAVLSSMMRSQSSPSSSRISSVCSANPGAGPVCGAVRRTAPDWRPVRVRLPALHIRWPGFGCRRPPAACPAPAPTGRPAWQSVRSTRPACGSRWPWSRAPRHPTYWRRCSTVANRGSSANSGRST